MTTDVRFGTGRRRLLHLVMTTVLLTVLTAPADAVYEFQTMLHLGAGNDSTVTDLTISPDGRYVVFRADREGDGEVALYSARLDGTANSANRLSAIADPARDVFAGFRISPDSTRVVFLGDLNVDEVLELFSAPLDASSPTVQLSPSIPGGTVFGFEIAPDSSAVVFYGDTRIENRTEVFSTPLDSATPLVTLSRSIADGDVTGPLQLSPDSSRVIYRGDLRNNTELELYSAPLSTTDSQVRLSNSDLPTGAGFIQGFAIAPDSSRVVYNGHLRAAGFDEIYSAPLDGSSPQLLLSTPPVTGGDVSFDFTITPDSERVVYHGDLRGDEIFEVYSAPLDQAGQQLVLNTAPVPGGDVTNRIGGMLVSSDSSRVVFIGTVRAAGVTEVFAAPVDAEGGQIVLSSSIAGGDVGFFGKLSLVPDSSRVVYGGDLREDGVQELFSAPLDASGQQVKLSSTSLPSGGDVKLWRIAPDSAHVVYLADLRTDGVNELFSAPIDVPGEQLRVSSNPPPGGNVADLAWEIAPDGSRVVYIGDMRSNDVVELFSASVTQSGTQQRLNTDPTPGGRVNSGFVIAPDSSSVLFTGDIRFDTRIDLYAAGAGQLPSRPVGSLSVDDTTTTAADISWDRPAFGSQVTGYRVDVEPSSRRSTTTVPADTTQLTVDGLSPGTDHTVTVVAVNDAGDSLPAEVSFTTDAVPSTDPPTDPPTGDPTDEPTPEPAGVVRLSGETRFDTAAAIALDRFDPDDVDIVYLATGRNFPDALAGGPLAAHVGAPILLVEPDSLPDITASTLATLNPTKVIALGGPVAVSGDVLTAAGTAGTATTSRLAGANRYATATAIADALITAGGDPTRTFLAIGTNFPDAVAAGPATASAPILLTPGSALAPDTQTWLTTNKPATITAVGGAAVLTGNTLTAAATAAGATPQRLSGENRYATATAIADTLGTGADAPTTVYIAVGTNFPDALTGGPAAAAEGAPIVLAQGGAATLPPDTAAYLDELPALRRIVVLGGPTAIPAAIITQLQNLLDAR